ncbi:hypothetical protein ACTFIW_006492 [Dictyostelium discoideum]
MNNNNNNNNNNYNEYIIKEIEYLRNRNDQLNDQNISLFRIIYDMRELMVKFYNFPKKEKYLLSELDSKDIEIQDIKNKLNQDLINLEKKLNQQIEKENNESKSKQILIDGLQKTIQDIESQKFIDNNEYENRIQEYKIKIQEYQEKLNDQLKSETKLKDELQLVINSKNDEIINLEHGKKEFEKQIGEINRENEQLKIKLSNYQQKILQYQQRQHQPQQQQQQQQQPQPQQQQQQQQQQQNQHQQYHQPMVVQNPLNPNNNNTSNVPNANNNNSGGGGGNGNHLNNYGISVPIKKSSLSTRKSFN